MCDLVKRCWPRYTGSSFSPGILFFSFFGNWPFSLPHVLKVEREPKTFSSAQILHYLEQLHLPMSSHQKANPQPTTGPSFPAPRFFQKNLTCPQPVIITLNTMIYPLLLLAFCSVYPSACIHGLVSPTNHSALCFFLVSSPASPSSQFKAHPFTPTCPPILDLAHFKFPYSPPTPDHAIYVFALTK